jgi:putative transposase
MKQCQGVIMHRELVRRRHLPHWDVPNAAYFVTTCLKGSIPPQGLLDLARYRADLHRRSRPTEVTEEEWQARCWKLWFVRAESWLDCRPANRLLEDPVLAQIVENSMFHFAGERYDLLTYVVMPSHFHWLFQPLAKWVETLPDEEPTPRERIMYSLNRFTATACNRLLQRKGKFWQGESYDHWVRDVDELERIMRYIEENPVKAGLVKSPEQWPFSSARFRKQMGTEWGVPLTSRPSGLES